VEYCKIKAVGLVANVNSGMGLLLRVHVGLLIRGLLLLLPGGATTRTLVKLRFLQDASYRIVAHLKCVAVLLVGARVVALGFREAVQVVSNPSRSLFGGL
jgi:hypothetical protein